MTSRSFTAEEEQQVRAAMAYWCEHWDFECPTLFGLELEVLVRVRNSWPTEAYSAREVEALAAIGSLRELLYGASTPPKELLPSIIGVEYEAASALCAKVHSVYRAT